MLVNSSASSESSEEVAAQVLSGLKASGEDDPCGWLTNDDGGGGCSEMVPIVFMCEAPMPTPSARDGDEGDGGGAALMASLGVTAADVCPQRCAALQAMSEGRPPASARRQT